MNNLSHVPELPLEHVYPLKERGMQQGSYLKQRQSDLALTRNNYHMNDS